MFPLVPRFTTFLGVSRDHVETFWRKKFWPSVLPQNYRPCAYDALIRGGTERGVYILHENQYAKVVFSNLICADHESEVKFDLS